MKKLTKTAVLILSALMLFGCTDNNAQSGAGDTTPPSESSVTDSKNESKTESSATENSSATDNTSKESEENLVKNIEGYQTFSYDADKYEITNDYIYCNIRYSIYDMFTPVEPNLDDLYKETTDVKSSELVALKCRVAGDSYVINDGKCGETLIMKPFLSLIYTPVVIEEVVDSNNGKCLYNKGDILYISEYYHITEQYNDRSLNFVQTAEENLKAQFENKSGEFDSSKHSEIEKKYYDGKMEYYNTLRSGNGRYIHTTWNPVLLQKGQSYLIFADNDTTANEVDGNIYNNAYPIVFDLEQSEPFVFKSEKEDNGVFSASYAYRYQWKILKEKYGEHFKSDIKN